MMMVWVTQSSCFGFSELMSEAWNDEQDFTHTILDMDHRAQGPMKLVYERKDTRKEEED